MKPLALDLCCGLGGWTDGLLAAGWDVIGFDITAWPGYKGKLVVGDVRQVKGSDYPGVSLVCASPPCQEFSKLSLPFFHKLKKSGFKPDESIWKACIRIAMECRAPLVLENVRGAETYMGAAKYKCGPYYLWGDVPALLPTTEKKKGLALDRYNFNGVRLDYKYQGPRRFSSHSKQRKEWSAKAAMIPIELSTWIGECFYPQEVTP